MWKWSQKLVQKVYVRRLAHLVFFLFFLIEKYFNFNSLGQTLENDQAEKVINPPENPSTYDILFIKYRNFTAMLIPMIFIHVSFLK